MLPNYLTSSYLQYKEDTNAVASWLAKTAKKCGYEMDLQKDKTGQRKKKGRQKGKARKTARKAKPPPVDSSTTKPTSAKLRTYIIAVRDFVPLAQWIVDCETLRVRVPSTFSIAIERAISARQAHQGILGGNGGIKDDGHTHFISILERVQTILQPLFLEEGKDGPANRFERLDIQEPSDKFVQTADIKTPETPEPEPDSDTQYEAEQVYDMDEMYSAFRLLIQDYHSFRVAINETWVGYQQGVFDLVSASIMTNTALEFARRLEKDAEPLFEKFGGSEQILVAAFLAQCKRMGEEESYREQSGDEFNFNVWEAASEIFFPTYMLLEAFVPMVSKYNMPIYKPGYFGVYDPASDRTKKTPREKFKEDKVILTEHFTEFALLAICVPDLDAEDELTRSFKEAFETHKITLSLVFATQVYLDIHHVLREGVKCGLSDLMTTAGMIDESINDNFQYHKSLHIAGWPRSNDAILKNIQQHIFQYTKKDMVGEARKRLHHPPSKPYRLLSSHPLLCGLLVYSLKVTFQDVSLAFADAWGSVLYTFHLYNAVKQEKLLGKNWTDMDVIMGIQGKIFVGNPPKTPEDYLKQFALSMGWSATAFAKDRHHGTLRASSRGPRCLKELAPVAQMFKARFCEGSGQTDWMSVDIEQIVSKSNWKEEPPSGDLRIYSMSQKEDKEQKRTTSARLDVIDLLKRLRNALQAESLELSLPYLEFHRICWSILRKINEWCKPALQEMFGVGYLERENQLPFVVGYIFMAATNTKKLSGLLGVRKSDEVTSKLLLAAATVIDKCIGIVGRLCCDILEQENIHVADESSDEDEDEDEDE
ncbi:hypothetical protein MaudCBS49596_002721 [Microsporum audouinii]